MSRLLVFAPVALLPALFAAAPPTDPQVGPTAEGMIVPTGQLIRPAGKSVSFSGRPIDLTLSPDGNWLYVKDNRGIVVIDTSNGKLVPDRSIRLASPISGANAR